MRQLVNLPGITFALFMGWKLALLLFTAQPVPANDSFFYDGPVVNYLLHGEYCNPSLAMVLPISSSEVFSAYPPLYQFVLLLWMKCLGTSALAAMWLHVTLLGAFVLLLFAILRQFRVPAAAINLAGLFLFGITFHDRPDTLAQVLGALALLAVVRGLIWPGATFLLLTFCTSLQIGGIYLLWIALLTWGGAWLGRKNFPWVVTLGFLGVLFGLIAVVRFGQPLWWAGFREHVALTPSFTGWRFPRPDDFLKIARTAPGVLLGLAALVWLLLRGERLGDRLRQSPQLFMASCGLLTMLALIAGCLFVLTPNTIHIASYTQALIVGSLVAALIGDFPGLRLRRAVTALFIVAALLVSIRAIGLTTWGAICARDVSHAQAVARVKAELDALPPASTVLVSSAFLYEAAQHTNVTWLHSDWPAVWSPGPWELNAWLKLRPAKMIVTQFDFYRREHATLNELKQRPEIAEVRITNTARVPVPDASRMTQRVVQHISWAPVVVDFVWRETQSPTPETAR